MSLHLYSVIDLPSNPTVLIILLQWHLKYATLDKTIKNISLIKKIIACCHRSLSILQLNNKNAFQFYYARQHICYSAYMPRQFRLSVCLSVRPSVTSVICVKTAERIIEILSRSDRPITLVFSHQGSLCKSEGITPNGGAKYKGVAIFDK